MDEQKGLRYAQNQSNIIDNYNKDLENHKKTPSHLYAILGVVFSIIIISFGLFLFLNSGDSATSGEVLNTSLESGTDEQSTLTAATDNEEETNNITQTENEITQIGIDQCKSNVECNSDDNCKIGVCEGEPKKCVFRDNKICMDYDGCCPSGCTYSTDKDCKDYSYKSTVSGGGSSKSTPTTPTTVEKEEIPCDKFDFLSEEDESNICNLKKAFIERDNKYCSDMRGEYADIFEEACEVTAEVDLMDIPILVQAMYYFDLALEQKDPANCGYIPAEYDEYKEICTELLSLEEIPY